MKPLDQLVRRFHFWDGEFNAGMSSRNIDDVSEYKETGQAINLDPKLDFMLDKTTPIPDLLRLVDELIFGRAGGALN